MLIKNVNVYSKDLGSQNNFVKDKAGGLILPDLKIYTGKIIYLLWFCLKDRHAENK